jgi:hypothetical protein
MHFSSYIGIDYSGARAAVSRLPGLRVFKASHYSEPARVPSPAGGNRNWTRKEIAHWCLEQINTGDPVIIGIDHGFSFPTSYMERYRIESWDRFLDDFQEYWPTDGDEITVTFCREGNKRSGDPNDLRLTENWTAGAKSVFRFNVQGSVAHSTHAGLPWLRFIRQNANSDHRPHFWPFDGFEIPPKQSVIVEIFPSLIRKRYSKREAYTADDHDAMCVAQWLKDMDGRGLLSTYFNPPLTDEERKIARLEGWILGVY